MNITEENYDFLYITAEQAKIELQNRQKDIELVKKVEDMFGSDFPDFLSSGPHACFSRMIFTAVPELDCAIDIADKVGLPICLLEYDSKFVAANVDKYTLTMIGTDSSDTKRGMKNQLGIVNFNFWEGELMSKITTHWGEKLSDFHHRILDIVHPGLSNIIIQFAPWFNKTRILNEHYYFYWLSLFICHGVLIEDFVVSNKDEKIFVNKKVVPSFNAIYERFGVKPLIVSLPRHSLDPENLGKYPKFVIDEVWEHLSGTK